jgi:DNA-binding transcriptional ArsR family regulator
MDDITLKPFSLDTFLTGYMPVPRELLNMNLPSTAILLYAVLLDRATLSRKNHYADSGGWVYAIYPIERLADTFHISDTSVKKHLRVLEEHGLIRRIRENGNRVNHIYLRLPTGSFTETFLPPDGKKSSCNTGRKVPPNNITEQHNKNDYYQHGEDESL